MVRGERHPEGRAGRRGGANKTRITVLVAVVGGGALLGIAALVAMTTLVVPKERGTKHRVVCMNNLRQISALLVARHSSGTLHKYDGPAFLLQVAEDVTDEDLAAFICPGEPEGSAPDRPPVGSPEFIRMYRELTQEDLAEDRDWSRYTSYAGPNLKDFPVDRYWDDDRLWACDRCPDKTPHHAGVAILWATSKVDFLALEHLGGSDDGKVIVGPDSPDPRLRKMSLGGGR